MKMSFFDTLDAVLRTGSLAAAAVEMNVTPSAVSLQMKQVEAHFGQPLFDRSGLQVRPMPFAKVVADLMRQPMQRLESLRRRTNVQVEGLLRMGVIETLQASMLPVAVHHLCMLHPALLVRPVQGRTIELIDAVKAVTLDTALVVQPPTGGSKRLHWLPVMRNELVLVAPPQATGNTASALFKAHEWIRFDPATHTGRLAARWVGAHTRDARTAMDLQSAHAIVAMVSAGLGVSVLPAPDVRMTLAYPVRTLKLGRDTPSLQISLVARKADAGNRQLAALHEAFEHAASTGLRTIAR